MSAPEVEPLSEHEKTNLLRMCAEMERRVPPGISASAEVFTSTIRRLLATLDQSTAALKETEARELKLSGELQIQARANARLGHKVKTQDAANTLLFQRVKDAPHEIASLRSQLAEAVEAREAQGREIDRKEGALRGLREEIERLRAALERIAALPAGSRGAYQKFSEAVRIASEASR